jgi:molybdenum cofactor cytidylyltransferase
MGTCKQLLPLGGGTIIGRCLETLVSSGIGEIVVVVSRDGQAVELAARRFPVGIVVNDTAEGDMASSVRAGRDALTDGSSGAIVALCDYPLVTSRTITRLVAEQRQSPGCIIIPCYLGRRGHPLFFPRAILNELTGDLTLRDLVRRDPGRILCLAVDDPGVLIDMDTPEDYHRICELMVNFM